jgi:CoB--CoM heterodisulfide reductase subunit B
MNKENAFFWGCTIQAKFPFMEKATRMVLDKLNVKYKDIDSFTCCPEKSLVKNIDEGLFDLTAIRNISLAENENLNIMSVCTGCYSNLKQARSKVVSNPVYQKKINEKLEKIGLNFSGASKITHFIEYLHDEVGINKIKANVKFPLRGLRIAIHYGCHLVRPSHAINFDSPFNPVKYDNILEALGANVVNYKNKMMCCGQSLDRVDEHDKALIMAGVKMDSFKEVSADAITTVCPSCFTQFDTNQFMLAKEGSSYEIPVITLEELMCLAFGLDGTEELVEFHKIKAKKFLDKFKDSKIFVDYSIMFDKESLMRCYDCQACRNDCPMSLNFKSYDPSLIIKMILDNDVERAMSSKIVWECLECHTCSELCPQNYSWETVLTTLKNIAIKNQVNPQKVKKAEELFFKTLRLGDPQEGARKKLGLPAIKKVVAPDFKNIIDENIL